MRQKIEFHEISGIFPLLEKRELQALADDIKHHGLHSLIKLFEGKILDGRSRYLACLMAKVEPEFMTVSGTPKDAVNLVWNLNLMRHHLSSSQAAICSAIKDKLLKMYGQKQQMTSEEQLVLGNTTLGRRKSILTGLIPETLMVVVETREVRAKAAGICASYISLADRLLKEKPALAEKVKNGKIKLTNVYRELKTQSAIE